VQVVELEGVSLYIRSWVWGLQQGEFSQCTTCQMEYTASNQTSNTIFGSLLCIYNNLLVVLVYTGWSWNTISYSLKHSFELKHFIGA